VPGSILPKRLSLHKRLHQALDLDQIKLLET
jgi:hypothetical protein